MFSKKAKTSVAIYYDGNCGFCRRSVELIVRFGLVRTSHVGPAQADQSMYTIMQTYDSWVVIDNDGQTHSTFQAGVAIARASTYLWVLVPLARPAFMQRFGERVYRLIARNRSRIWLP